MKRILINILVTLLAVLLFLTSCSGSAQKEKALEMIDKFYTLYSEQDIEGLTDLMHPDIAGDALTKVDLAEVYTSIRAVNGNIEKYKVDKAEGQDGTFTVSVLSEYEHGSPVTDTFELIETDSGYLFSEINMPSAGVIEEVSEAFYDAFSRRDTQAIYDLHCPTALSISAEEYAAYFETFFIRFGKLENLISFERYPNIYGGSPDLPVVCVEYYTFAEGDKEIEMEVMYCVYEEEVGLGTVYIDDSKETKDY